MIKSFSKIILDKSKRIVIEINTTIRPLICLQENNDSYSHSIWKSPFWDIAIWKEDNNGNWKKVDQFYSSLVRRSDSSEFVRESNKIKFWGEKYPEFSELISVASANEKEWKEGKILLSYL